MLEQIEQIKKIVANGNQSGVVNSKIAVFKGKAKIDNTVFDVEAEDKTALYNILPLYWLVEHPTRGLIRLGNCSGTVVAGGHVYIEVTRDMEDQDLGDIDKYDGYLVIANWPDNMAITTYGLPDDFERVI